VETPDKGVRVSLNFELKVNSTPIGTMEIRRTVDLNGSTPAPNAKYSYVVYVDGKMIGEVDHRYGDGPWALVHKATMLATYHPSGDYAHPSGIDA
jgi:hypothetical protein